MSLADIRFILDDGGPGPWSLRGSGLTTTTWDPLPSYTEPVSLQALERRFGPPGRRLREFADGTGDVWAHMDRPTLVGNLRERIRQPGSFRQQSSHLCGPMAILFELARREPVRLIDLTQAMFETGEYKSPTGWMVVGEAELRGRPVGQPAMDQLDWMLAAAMRDDMNITDDVDSGRGIEGITGWGGMKEWCRGLLTLPGAGWFRCFETDEDEAMRRAEISLGAGGVAFFLIDACLITADDGDDEEPIWFRTRDFPSIAPGDWHHSTDDDFPPDHWAVHIGGLSVGPNPGDGDPVLFRVWSWGSEYEIQGNVDAFAEYLYGVVWATT
jgi:hypothetical protein